MSGKKIFFGHPTGHMQWVPAPLAGAEAQNINYVDSIEFENGGADVYRSRPYRKQYDFEFSAPIKGSEGLNVFNKFASGFYGGGTCIFADPYAFETNLFGPQWATPALIEQGWKNIAPVTPSFVQQRGAVRTNLATNPAIGGSLANVVAGRGTLSDGGTYLRNTITDALASNLAQIISQSTSAGSMAPASPGEIFTVQADGRASAYTSMSVAVQFFDASRTFITGSQTQGAGTTVNASTFTTLAPVTATAPANTAFVRWLVGLNGTAARNINDTLDVRNVIVERSSTARGFFSGATSDTALIDYAWTGTANASTSTATNILPNNGQPRKAALFDITTGAGAIPSERFTIPIPPTHTLHLGASGSTTGNGRVAVRPILTGGTYDSPVLLTMLDPTLSTRMNTTFSGATYQAVEVFIYRTETVASTVTLTSMMAQLWKTGTSPVLTGDHVAGDGHTGLEFADDARVETYLYINPPRKALSTTLVEVGAWR